MTAPIQRCSWTLSLIALSCILGKTSVPSTTPGSGRETLSSSTLIAFSCILGETSVPSTTPRSERETLSSSMWRALLSGTCMIISLHFVRTVQYSTVLLVSHKHCLFKKMLSPSNKPNPNRHIQEGHLLDLKRCKRLTWMNCPEEIEIKNRDYNNAMKLILGGWQWSTNDKNAARIYTQSAVFSKANWTLDVLKLLERTY